MLAETPYENPEGITQKAKIGHVPGRVITCLNVNDALPKGLAYLQLRGRKASPRGVPVLEAHGPVITNYLHPAQCVLYDEVRLCNHFFHFMESLWMLSGRNDVEFLKNYVNTIDQFSDDGKTFYGAYGYRLRGDISDILGQGRDQLNGVVRKLTEDPMSRQAVAAIWERDDLEARTKDLPCNNLLYFSIRDNKLYMTIVCRSNDIIWGAYGANAVHFSFIMRWVAAALGVGVGEMFQFSNNYHVYCEREDYAPLADPAWLHRRSHAPYVSDIVETELFSNVTAFDREVQVFCADITRFNRSLDTMNLKMFYDHDSPIDHRTYDEPVFTVGTALQNLWTAHRLWVRAKRPAELMPVTNMFDPDGNYVYKGLKIDSKCDWIAGARQWLETKELRA
jgi:hypothetical protein